MTVYTRAEDVSNALFARLQTITKANGYETDIGVRAYKGRRNVDESQVPCVILIEGADSATDRPGRIPSVAITQTYVIAAYATVAHPDNPNDDAHKALRDIKRAVFKDDATLGGKVLRVKYTGRDIGPRADGVPVVFVTVDLEVDYVEDLTNP